MIHTATQSSAGNQSGLDASGLIDVLKEIKAGKFELAAVIQGAAA